MEDGRRLKYGFFRTLLMGLVTCFGATFIFISLRLQPQLIADFNLLSTQTSVKNERLALFKTNATTSRAKGVPNIVDRNHLVDDVNIVEFTRQEGAVIVTKVHGPHQLSLLKQSMCLLHYAYNRRVNYDIVLFTTIPIPEDHVDVETIRKTIHPAKLKVVLDNDGIVREIEKLSPTRRKIFLKRCNVSSPAELTWDSECPEEGTSNSRLSYNWQSEFRSLHIWKHPSLEEYRYMMWIDTDAFCTKPWDRDPLAIAMKNQMVIYFNNYPQGRAKAAQPRVKQVFGNYICSSRKSPTGQMITTMSDECEGAQLWTIHGFFHITNLDFFRQDPYTRWAETMVGDCFLCRKFDDQLAVTVPTLVLAPNRSWDMYRSGVELKIYHNNKIDGKSRKRVAKFDTLWNQSARDSFQDAWGNCQITEIN